FLICLFVFFNSAVPDGNRNGSFKPDDSKKILTFDENSFHHDEIISEFDPDSDDIYSETNYSVFIFYVKFEINNHNTNLYKSKYYPEHSGIPPPAS
ncbi:MAG: hypothetical protein K8R21_08310, partial [Leptospira sp.]|nr:hypothetical protein [Leptospira sp.]